MEKFNSFSSLNETHRRYPSKRVQIQSYFHRVLCLALCTVIVTFLVTLVVLLVTFRKPQSIMSSAQLLTDNLSLDTVGSGGTLSMVWLVTLVVTNQWFQPIVLNALNTSASFGVLPQVEIGSGRLKEPITLLSNTDTVIEVPMSISYSLSADPDWVVLKALIGCQSAPPDTTLSILYKANVSVSVFGIGPIGVPTIQGDLTIDCPRLDASVLLQWLTSKGLSVNSLVEKIPDLAEQIPDIINTIGQQIGKQVPDLIGGIGDVIANPPPLPSLPPLPSIPGFG